MNGSKESLIHAATIMRESPDAIFAFNRQTGKGSFDIAVKLRKPNILKLVLTILVDGTLEARQGETATMLVTKMPTEGLKTLKDLILHHPPEFAMTILKNMNFIKVPFTEPRRCLISDNMVRTEDDEFPYEMLAVLVFHGKACHFFSFILFN